MKKIIYTQNAVIAGLITVIALITGFYEIKGLKLFIVAVMGFFVLNYLLLQGERLWLRWWHENKGKTEGEGSAFQGIPWFKHKMRHPGTVQENRNPGGNAKKIQKGTRYDTALQGSRYC